MLQQPTRHVLVIQCFSALTLLLLLLFLLAGVQPTLDPYAPAFCGWLVGWLDFNVTFQHKSGYIRDEPAFCDRPTALTQEGRVRLMMCASVCVTEG